MPATPEGLVETAVELPSGRLPLRQPAQWADLPDDGAFEWAPIAPYWAVMWRSGVAVARRLDAMDLSGRRVIELGCGLGLPSLAAARAGATVVATDEDTDALEVVALNAASNGLEVETATFDFRAGEPPAGPFDLVIAADVLYEEETVASLLELLPRLAPAALVASPERRPYERFLAEAKLRWPAETSVDGLITIAELSFGEE